MGFREEIRAVIKKHSKRHQLANDREATMAAICLQEIGWDGDGFSYTEGRYKSIEKHMRFLDRFRK